MTGHLSCTIIIGKNADRGKNNERSTAPGKDFGAAPWGQRTHQCQCTGRKAGVSRQIVVGDVALLRAGGAEIEATPRGYQFHPTPGGYTGILACVHRTADEMRTELYTVVDQGGVVVDVAVENPLYGELRGNLNLASRYDVDTFITQAANTPECLLSRMTGGVHLHTLRCPDEETFQRIEAALREKGILY